MLDVLICKKIKFDSKSRTPIEIHIIMLKNFILSLIIFNVMSFSVHAQLPPKVTDDNLFGKDCFYFKMLPSTGTKGLLVLVPGYGEHPFAVAVQTSIVQNAIKNRIAVIIVSLSPNNDTFNIDLDATQRLGEMIDHFFKAEKINHLTPVFLGGFSAGGTTALSFYSNNFKAKGDRVIKKIFLIDPPLDLTRLYNSLLKSNDKEIADKLASVNIKNQTLPEVLFNYSLFSPKMDLKELPDYKNTALRIYCEPDVLWWIKNRSVDYSGMNVIDCAGYINALLKKDRENRVELIITNEKGIRNGNERHPHSWSIAEPSELIEWLLSN